MNYAANQIRDTAAEQLGHPYLAQGTETPDTRSFDTIASFWGRLVC